MAAGERLRIAILWQGMSGYTRASFGALADRGVDVRLLYRVEDAHAPFDTSAVTRGLEARSWAGAPDPALVEGVLDDLDPHAVVVSSWHIHAYRRAVRRRKGTTVRIVTMDNQWWATPKQILGVVTAPATVRPAFDAAFVAGERAADFARRLGFRDERIIRGLYTCDHPRFAAVAAARGGEAPPPAFVFVGRLVDVKGIDTLAAGYRRYRDLVPDPWPLLVAGTGPGAARLDGAPGVEQLGFLQPDDLPALLARSGCLVLPSRFEPWAVVVHEAAAAGLPVVCTWVCGAAGRLVLDGYNGSVVTPGDPDALAGALARMSRAGDAERRAMSAASVSLAAQFTPDRWADLVVARVAELRAALGLAPAPAPTAPPRSAPV
jgi:glycosyltransferase involved in cell wall biosynthesis